MIVLEGVRFEELPFKVNDSEFARYARYPKRRPDGSIIFGHSWSAEVSAPTAKEAIRALFRKKRLTNPNATAVEVFRWGGNQWQPLKYA